MIKKDIVRANDGSIGTIRETRNGDIFVTAAGKNGNLEKIKEALTAKVGLQEKEGGTTARNRLKITQIDGIANMD